MQTTDTKPAAPEPITSRLVPIAKRWAPAILGAAAGAQLQSRGAGTEVIDFVKDFGLPTAILLLSGAKLTQWVERCAAFLAPEIKGFSTTFNAIAAATSENTKLAAATATLLTEADQQGRHERADLADALKDAADESKGDRAKILGELAVIRVHVERLTSQILRGPIEAVVPKDASP